MPPKPRKDSSGKTLADKALDKYVDWIVEEIYKEYGLGKKGTDITDIEDKKLAWRTLHAWDLDKENFAIEHTKLYLRLLDSNDSNSTNLQFLKALVNRMALYLSEYCQKGPKRSQNRAISILKDALYTNNPYIRGLELYQAERRANGQPRTMKSVADRKKRARIQAYKDKCAVERQVRVEFVEVSYYRKK